MASEHLVAALDIGTTKIVALVGEVDAEGRIYVIGHGESPAEGLRRGVVVNMEKTVNSIRKAIDDAQMISGTEIDKVTAGIAGEHVRSINSHGVIAVSRTDNEITRTDANRAIEAARAVAIPVDREIIHVIPQEYTVDDQTNIKNPVGMTGVRLEVKAHIVTASVTTAKNIYRAMERCRLSIDHIALESLALSNVLLTEDETDSGVILVDIGGDLTNVSVFFDGAIRHTAVVPLGGKHITNDVAIGLRISPYEAENIKKIFGAAMSSLVEPKDTVPLHRMGGKEDKEISRSILASIIEPRLEEILSLVMREVRQIGIENTPTAGVVITGGGAQLAGAAQLAEQITDMPVRIGQVLGIEHTPDELCGARYATVHGLLKYAVQHEPVNIGKRDHIRGFMKRFESWIASQF
jgi:cell division protein FtsA